MIALNEPFINGKEIFLVKKCIKSTWISTSGSYIKKFENLISNFTNSKFVVAVSSGTAALHLILRVIDIKKNEEIIIPTITFIAPVNAISYVNAKPIFLDVDASHNLDISKTIEFINKKTFFKNGFTYNSKTRKKIRAIIVVHMWGNVCNFSMIKKLCKKRNIKIIEDASESLGSYFYNNKNKKHAGTLADISCLSFNGNKILTTGAGGAVLTNNKKYQKKILYLATQAKDDPVRFIHNDIGYNYRMPNLNAAFGCAQFKTIKKFITNKKKNFQFYQNVFNKINGIDILKVSNNSISNNWMNILKINSKILKITPFKLHQKLKSFNIETRLIWKPNHLQKKYISCENYKIHRGIEIFSSCICIPSSSNLKKIKLQQIVQAIKKSIKV